MVVVVVAVAVVVVVVVVVVDCLTKIKTNKTRANMTARNNYEKATVMLPETELTSFSIIAYM